MERTTLVAMTVAGAGLGTRTLNYGFE